jgi:uncharacterized DUF497 family protein
VQTADLFAQQMALTLEWDPLKAASNLEKHSVSFDEAVTAFADSDGRLAIDDRHSQNELRLVLLGRSVTRRYLAVMFTNRAPDRIRIISARIASRRERSQYEEGRG